ncbi:MAG TPA: ABC transporter permease [Jatrophihabitantaceae bacterium]|nr:ABC transporter permease [Jatrophihabitantaceae bacterium]
MSGLITGERVAAVGRPVPSHLTRVHSSPRYLHGFGSAAREIWQLRELLLALVRKELKVKYRNSVLGFVWSLLLPISQLAVYWLVMGQFLNAGVIPYYGVFIFCGLAVWFLFAEILNGATVAIVNNGGLVKKVYFARELFPLAATGAAIVNFLFQLTILVGATIAAGAASGKWPDLSLLPMPIFALLDLVVFGTALGLLLAAANVYLRDIEHLITIVVMLWFWFTPIIYDVGRVSKELPHALYDVYLLNPMAPVVWSFQKFFWPQGAGTQFDFTGSIYPRLGALFVVSLVLLWFAQRVFARAQGNFAQEL